jgi:hypothetical protein
LIVEILDRLFTASHAAKTVFPLHVAVMTN